MARKVKVDTVADSDDLTDKSPAPITAEAPRDPVSDICAACEGMKRDAIAAALRSAWARMK